MKNINHLANFVWIFLLILSCSKNSQKQIDRSSNKPFQFTEIGRKELLEVNFPDQWNILAYLDNDAPPMTTEAVYFEKKLNDLDYFDSFNGRPAKTEFYKKLLTKKNQKIDSLFILDSISNKDIAFVYIKSYKTENGNYDWPPTFQDIDLLIFSKSKFKEKVNIYSNRNYPYSAGIKLGYLDFKGNLFTKEFEIDEVNTTFVKEEHIKISNDGNVKIVSTAKNPKIKKHEELLNTTASSLKWEGQYQFEAANRDDAKTNFKITINSLEDIFILINDDGAKETFSNIKAEQINPDKIKIKYDSSENEMGIIYIEKSGNKYFISGNPIYFINPGTREGELIKKK